MTPKNLSSLTLLCRHLMELVGQISTYASSRTKMNKSVDKSRYRPRLLICDMSPYMISLHTVYERPNPRLPTHRQGDFVAYRAGLFANQHGS